jgi:hypothetical protein
LAKQDLYQNIPRNVDEMNKTRMLQKYFGNNIKIEGQGGTVSFCVL